MMYLSDEKSDDSSDSQLSENAREEEQEAKAMERWEKKLYKPTGPDG